MLYVFLLCLGVILFVVNLVYFDKSIISIFGLLLSGLTIGLSGDALQSKLDDDFKDDCVVTGGRVMEMQSGRLGCVNLSEIQYDRK